MALILQAQLFLLHCATTISSSSTPPPNIAIIVADDLGTFDLGINGHPSLRTPNIDALARGGMLFTQWLSSAPICTPSRSSLYTGRLPIRTGLYADSARPATPPNNASQHFGLDAWQKKDGLGGLPHTEVTLPTLLGARGYRSMLVGKWHLGQVREFWPLQHGFDQYVGTISTHGI